jgi:hypothetical protein
VSYTPPVKMRQAAQDRSRPAECERCGQAYTQVQVLGVSSTDGSSRDGWVPVYCPPCTRKSLRAMLSEANRLMP